MKEIIEFVKQMFTYGQYGYLAMTFFILAFLCIIKAIISKNKILPKICLFLIFLILGNTSLEYAKSKHSSSTSSSDETCYVDSLVEEEGYLLSTHYEDEEDIENEDNVKFIIKSSYLELNAKENNQIGIKIHLSLAADNLLDRSGYVNAYLESPKGTGVKDMNGNYCSGDGHVLVADKWKSKYKHSIWEDFSLFLPNEELHALKEKNEYYFCIQVNMDEQLMAECYIGPFTYIKTKEIKQSSQIIKKPARTKPCLMCMGSGKWICEACRGTRTTIEHTIDIFGIPDIVNVRCWKCLGSGKSNCVFCGGNGTILNRIYNFPQKEVPDGAFECLGCDRTGYAECTICGGLGIISASPISYCPGCKGSGIGACSICGGLGYKYPNVNITEGSGATHLCRACKASGDCQVCKGTSQTKSRIQYHSDWSKELVNEKCHACKGTGRCSACGGDGKLDEGQDF